MNFQVNSTKIGIYNTAWRLIVDSSGNGGIGTTNPGYALDVNGGVNALTIQTPELRTTTLDFTTGGGEIQSVANFGTQISHVDPNPLNNTSLYVTAGYIALDGVTSDHNAMIYLGDSAGCPTSSWFRIENNGTSGTASCTGNHFQDLAVGKLYLTSLQYADIAEIMNVNPSAHLESGDIVTSSREVNASSNQLQQSNTVYDSSVVGVVSSPQTATMVLGINGSDPANEWNVADKKPIALTGKVLVKVSSTNGPIAKGDLVTTSSISGFGMKATQNGQIVGKALADFDPNSKTEKFINCPSGTPSQIKCAQLLIFLNITWQGGLSSQNTNLLQAQINNQQTEIEDLKQQIQNLQSSK